MPLPIQGGFYNVTGQLTYDATTKTGHVSRFDSSKQLKYRQYRV